MKGIILAGGKGSRLYPVTKGTNKHLLSVYDKPLIYYPLTVLIAANIREIAIISSPDHIESFKALLGDGSQYGLKFNFFIQDEPNGIPECFIIAEQMIKNENVMLILGDNIFSGGSEINDAAASFTNGAHIFAYKVNNPNEYGVVRFNEKFNKIKKFIEKPDSYIPEYAVPGVYLYDKYVSNYVKQLKKSDRGEYEISDLNNLYLNKNNISFSILKRGYVWLDSGNPSSLTDAANYIYAVEKRQGIKIGCPEEAAYNRKLLSKKKLEVIARKMPVSDYRNYLMQIVDED